MKFIDIAANLTDPMYQGIYHGKSKHQPDLLEVLSRSWAQGIEKIIVTGGSLKESAEAIKLAQSSDQLFATVGCHPTRCTEMGDHPEGSEGYLRALSTLVEDHRGQVVAFGEFGLDYDRLHFCDMETQRKYFEKQLETCEPLGLPLFLHCRNAASDLVEILSKFEGKLKGGVVHSFDGSLAEAESIMGLGYHIGINGCSLRTEDSLKVVEALPVDRLMIETDCPWCEIRPSHPGFKLVETRHDQYPCVKKEKWKPGATVKSRNEPCNIVQVLEIVAAVKSLDQEELAQKILDNTNGVFFP